jgi:hypothetical protein
MATTAFLDGGISIKRKVAWHHATSDKKYGEFWGTYNEMPGAFPIVLVECSFSIRRI